MRADRILAELLIMQRKGHVTAAELAGALEVSVRTIYRDWDALRVAGVPLITDPGPGGGCRLYGDWRTELSGMTTEELEALTLLATAGTAGALGDRLTTALAKLGAAVPDAFPGDRLLLDMEGTGATVPLVRTLLRAANSGRVVEVRFRRLFDTRVRRIVHPLGLVSDAGRWHLVWTAADRRVRVDPVERVDAAVLLGSHFERPTGWRLDEFWRRHREKREGLAGRYEVIIRVDPDLAPLLRRRYGNRFSETPRGETSLRFDDLEGARSELLAYGSAVEVIEPVALRLTLVDFAEQILRKYRVLSTEY